ncbi:helix-turn-helix domain-containing protein [Pseudooceanicola algae]|uniref:DnaA N-terminal domain-containing protein n=1 Tax=Pseudooceanicola algae TaxID=1537215 RepID=A0A418SBQ4_9RHOB|nr:hypothetical protein [Pseudooceanicola algae]QPM92440.1 hypothetical protein PSAL_037040 [Pseudooceanicola algae]
MQIVKPVGKEAASRKYDLLSALSVHGLGADPGTQRRVLRLISLITARYNWQRDELCVGQREIARMWSVDERTVKREMARLRALGWLVQKTRGARGRISTYGLDLVQILEDTRPAWGLVGEDFVARLGPAEGVAETNVVPMRPVSAPKGQGVWAGAQALLAAEQPGLYGAWLSGLTEVEISGGKVVLAAGSSFQQSYIATHCKQVLTAALRRVDPALQGVEIIC